MFQPTDKECADIKRVQETHTCTERTAIGGQWTYSFTPTSIGVKITIRCCICDYTYDATEYDSW
jgi:hypothetical protein